MQLASNISTPKSMSKLKKQKIVIDLFFLEESAPRFKKETFTFQNLFDFYEHD